MAAQLATAVTMLNNDWQKKTSLVVAGSNLLVTLLKKLQVNALQHLPAAQPLPESFF
jgi:hypothetical protein